MTLIRRIIGKCCHIFHINVAKFFSSQGEVYMLHWIGDDYMDEETAQFCITTAQFQRLLAWLKSKNVIRLENWEQEKNYYVITFDDVPQNFYLNAYPLLREAKIPFTIFINISLLGKDGYITTDQLIDLSRCDLCTIGSHGMSHEQYALLNRQQVLYELLESRSKLENIINRPVEMFAYPYGSYYACGYRFKHLAKGVYKYAFGTISCPITSPRILKKWFLPRINIDSEFVNSLSINEDCKCNNPLL